MTDPIKKRSAAYLVPVAVFLVLVARFWHPVYGLTSFLMFDRSSDFARIGAVHEQPVFLHKAQGSYDGQFYAQLAQHPLLDSPEVAPAMDNYSYRARRILPSMIAWLLALGSPERIFNTYCLVNVLAWLALSAVLWDLIEVREARTWIAWFGVLFSAGALVSVVRALTDLVAVAFIALALLLATSKKRVACAVSLAASALCRETALLSAVGLFRPKSRGEAKEGRLSPRAEGLLLGCLAAAPFLTWAAYVRFQAGPAMKEWDNFTWPFMGLVGKWRESLGEMGRSTDELLTVTSLLTLVSLTVQAAYLAVTFERKDRWSRLGAAYLVLMAFLGPAVWAGYPGAACRVLLPMTLAFNLLAARRCAPLAWLLMGNLTVFSGLLFLKDVPHDETEISNASGSNGSGVLRRGVGWLDQEHSWSHSWMWSSKSGVLEIECWPRSLPQARLEFSTRTTEPTVVTIRSAGKILWTQCVGRDPEPVSILVPLSDGVATLTLSSATQGAAIPGDPRILSFEVYDPKLVLAAPTGPPAP